MTTYETTYERLAWLAKAHRPAEHEYSASVTHWGAVALGRRGGLARARALTPEQRSLAARHAVTMRWAARDARRRSEQVAKPQPVVVAVHGPQ